MATSVTLPALGESVTEGTVTRWLKQPGDQVAVDEPLLEVSTDKVDTEIPSPVAGTLLEIKAEEDETVEVGAELCTIGDEGESGGSDDSSDEASGDGQDQAPSDDEQDEQSANEAPAAAADDSSDGDEDADRKTETETEPPAAETDDSPPAQETSPASSDTKPEAEASSAGTSGSSGGTSVTLPALGESVTEGTVTRWLKQVGDEVAVDEPLLEVSTDKVDTEIPSPVAGTLQEIKVAEDETVEVGAELAIIGSGDAGGSGGDEKSAPPAEEKEPEPEARSPRRSPSPRRRSPSRRRRSRSPRRRPSPSRPRSPPPASSVRRPTSRRSPVTPARAPTSPRWCARWPPSRAWTCPR